MRTEGSGRELLCSRGTGPLPLAPAAERTRMDLHTAIAVSMLGASRSRASLLFKELRQRDPAVPLGAVLEALRVAEADRPGLEATAIMAASTALAAARDRAMEPIPWFDPRYPALLNCIADPPPVLWTRGEPETLSQPVVAIVGSRAATPYALDVGARLAAELS